jgi:N-acetylmuramoyl-L-alanine amidase
MSFKRRIPVRLLSFLLLAVFFVLPVHAGQVVLDVGHSLKAPGATSASGVSEFYHNQALAYDVSGMLTMLQVPHRLVGYEGKADVLTDRTRQAAGAALFVSLHHDSIQPQFMARATDFSGYSLFVSRKNRFSKQSLACARLLGQQFQAMGFHPSPHHNQPIKGENRPWADEALGVYWFDDLIVLKTARQPAVLVEAGVIVNPVEEQYITSPEGRSKVAAAVSSGIRQCLP